MSTLHDSQTLVASNILLAALAVIALLWQAEVIHFSWRPSTGLVGFVRLRPPRAGSLVAIGVTWFWLAIVSAGACYTAAKLAVNEFPALRRYSTALLVVVPVVVFSVFMVIGAVTMVIAAAREPSAGPVEPQAPVQALAVA
jgi:hypothetical protein